MKKLLLLIATGMAVLPSFGQQNQSSVVFVPNLSMPDMMESVREVRPSNSTNKTTAGGTAWFGYGDIMAGQSSKFYYNNIAPDSNILYQGSSGPAHVFLHGMGHCFDPTDSAFFAASSSAGFPQNVSEIPPFVVTDGNTYTVDSLRFESKYIRNVNVDDTMYIQVLKAAVAGSTNPFGIFSLQFTTSQERFVSPMYDPATNLLSDSIASSAGIQTIKIVLDEAFRGDTTANGFSNRTRNGIKIPTTINAAKGDIIIAYVTIVKPGMDTLNTPIGSTNLMRLYSYDIPGADAEPIQNKNSAECGLVATNQVKYKTSPDDFSYQGHKILIPSIAYASDGLMTDFGFKVTCLDCPELSVGNLNGNISATTAYPNPASTEVRVRYALKNAANVNVSLANAVGQVVKVQNMGNNSKGEAVFTTSDLANGLYFYTVEANGQRTTNRITVAH